MKTTDICKPSRTDYLIALALGLCALAVYVRTLAPDILYGDSAEFQTLAYTLGMTHCTGYPVYLLLARVVGFIPIGVPAWRISLFSAIGAGVTVGTVYLLVRYLTRSRLGALLAGVTLAVSYTFWSQAVIAEVYTPATAFIALIMLFLWRWRAADGPRDVFIAALLAGLGLGVHATVALIGPVALAFVLWTLWVRRRTGREWRRSLTAAVLGTVAGVGLYLLAFLAIDLHNTSTSFYQVGLIPSRSTWGLTASDVDSPVDRFIQTVTAKEWQDAMFPRGVDTVWQSIGRYGKQVTSEFPAFLLPFALLGLISLGVAPGLGAFTVVAFFAGLFFVLGYEPGDKYVFFLSTYLPIVILMGAGVGYPLQWLHDRLAMTGKRPLLALPILLGAAVIVLAIKPVAPVRLKALKAGVANFVKEDYPYPVKDLKEPRRVASAWLACMEDNAVLLTDWRALYSTYYLAQVEQGRTGIRIMESSVHGGDGGPGTSLTGEINKLLREGRPVYTSQVYNHMREEFNVQRVPGCDLYRLTARW